MPKFVVLVDYLRPLTEIDALVPAHRVFLQTHYDAGVFLLSGPRSPRIGGVILAQAESRNALESILAQDPFAVADVARYQVVEFNPNLSAASLAHLLA